MKRFAAQTNDWRSFVCFFANSLRSVRDFRIPSLRGAMSAGAAARGTCGAFSLAALVGLRGSAWRAVARMGVYAESGVSPAASPGDAARAPDAGSPSGSTGISGRASRPEQPPHERPGIRARPLSPVTPRSGKGPGRRGLSWSHAPCRPHGLRNCWPTAAWAGAQPALCVAGSRRDPGAFGDTV